MNNHDELMSNFFAQADALAYGKVKYVFLFPGMIVFPLFMLIQLNLKGCLGSQSNLLISSFKKQNVFGKLLFETIYKHFLWK